MSFLKFQIETTFIHYHCHLPAITESLILRIIISWKDYVSADAAVYITKASTSVDILISCIMMWKLILVKMKPTMNLKTLKTAIVYKDIGMSWEALSTSKRLKIEIIIFIMCFRRMFCKHKENTNIDKITS